MQLLDVPYKGVNSEIPDLTGGQLNVAFPVPQVVLGAIRSGKLRVLAVMGSQHPRSVHGRTKPATATWDAVDQYQSLRAGAEHEMTATDPVVRRVLLQNQLACCGDDPRGPESGVEVFDLSTLLPPNDDMLVSFQL